MARGSLTSIPLVRTGLGKKSSQSHRAPGEPGGTLDQGVVGAVRSSQIRYSILKAGLSYFLEGPEVMYKGREESRITFYA